MSQRKGVVVVLVLIAAAMLVSLGGLLFIAVLAGGAGAPAVARNSTLVVRVGGTLEELEPRGLAGQFLAPPPTVRSVVESLRRAKTDDRVTGVVIAPLVPSAMWAKVQEVRDAIVDFKSSGKPITGFLEYGGEQEFYLASACDQVFLLPTSTLDLTGLATYELFLRGMFDKIGAEPDMLHIGDYKTAANLYMERTYTAAHREMAASLNEDLFDQIVAGIAEARGKTAAEVRDLFDHGPFLPEDAVEAGLVDGLAYQDQVHALAGLPGDEDRIVGYDTYRHTGDSAFGGGPRIAVIYAAGIIASGDSGVDAIQGGVVGADTIVGYLRRAREDRSIRAIVLRIDSPGGSAVASDVIWREMERARTAKPLVASMSDVAASGGYYIALPAHAIVAQPATLTGSIGVVMGKVAIGGTLDRLGINLEGIGTGRYAGLTSPVRPFTPEERAKVGEMMRMTYDTFVKKTADARHTTVEAIDAVAQGRVWTGRQAQARGLVDELGGLARAIALAKARAGIDAGTDVSLVIFPPRRGLLDALANPFGAAAAVGLPWGLGPRERQAIGTLTAPLRLFRRGEPLALMPNVFLR